MAQHVLIEMGAARIERQAVGKRFLSSFAPWPRGPSPSTHGLRQFDERRWRALPSRRDAAKLRREFIRRGSVMRRFRYFSLLPRSPRAAIAQAPTPPVAPPPARARQGRADDPGTSRRGHRRRRPAPSDKNAEKWDVTRPPRPRPRRCHRHAPRHLDVARRLARRARDRLRPARRPLCHADRRRRGARDRHRPCLGHAAALFARRAARSPSPPTAAAATISGRCDRDGSATRARSPRKTSAC